MADVPSEVAYGTVRWRAVAFSADSIDVGNVPDMTPMTGVVTIRSLVSRTRYPSITVPLTAFMRTAVCPVVAGWLCRPDSTTQDVPMVSSFQVDADVHTIQYEAVFLMDDLASNLQPPPLVFTIPDGGIVDLSTILPQAATPPIVYVVDDTIRVAAEAAAASAAASAAAAQQSLDDLLLGVGPAVEDYLTANPPTFGPLHIADILDATATGQSIVTAVSGPSVRSIIGAGTSSLALGGTGVATTAMHSDWRPLSSDISDSTAVGQAVIIAPSQTAARTAIGAGTSSLALGGTGSAVTAMHSDWRPAANTTDLVGATTIGIGLLTATTQAGARAVIGAGTGSGGSGSVYVYHWNGTAYVDPAGAAVPSTAPAGASWRVYLGPASPVSPPVWTGIPTSFFAA